MDKKKPVVAYQSNKLVEAKLAYTLPEHKLYLLCLTKLMPQLPWSNERGEHTQKDFEEIVIPKQELIEWFGSKHLHDVVLAAADAMSSKAITVNTDDIWVKQNVFSRLTYDKKREELHVLFDNNMKPFLLDLERGGFTTVLLRQFFLLNSVYSQRLYLLIMEYRKLGKRTIGIPELRAYMGAETKLSQMRDLTARVLDVAVRDITAKTFYSVSYEKNKVGRRIESITFTWSKKMFDEEGNLLPEKKLPLKLVKKQEEQHARYVAEINNGYYEAKEKGKENEFIASLPLNLQAKIKERLAGK